MDCGPACIRMIAKYYGKNFSLQTLRAMSGVGREGATLLNISRTAQVLGFRTIAVNEKLEMLEENAPLPFIAHWEQNHYLVVYKIRKGYVYVADPAKGHIKYNKKDFTDGWATHENGLTTGFALLMEPTAAFFQSEGENVQSEASLSVLLKYLFGYKKLIVQLFLGIASGSILMLIFPFLTQSIVDIGINTQNISFIYLVLFAQLSLFIGQNAIEFVRSWILLHICSRVNVSILSDFFIKLTSLRISFFDVKMFGDIMQRISDYSRVEMLLTNTSLNIIFSIFTLIIFSVVLVIYSYKILLIFLAGSALYVLWTILFLKKRRSLDFMRFDIASKNHHTIIQLISGMQEIKMNNCENQKRWQWEHIQARLFRLNIRMLKLGQYQQAGAVFINEGKNILISFYAAKLVLDGNLTLGAMLAVQYIIGQLNGPVEQLLQLSRSLQDAKLTLERFNEIHKLPDEETEESTKIKQLPARKSFIIESLSFSYPGTNNQEVLRHIHFDVPEGKTTAIVGSSGSGKTTLLKLLLKFYDPTSGKITVGDTSLQNIGYHTWRENCGVVLQDGFIFSDTIANNIAVGDEYINLQKLYHACYVANIQEFVNALPLNYNTRIGADGVGISQGQKQRILIARAVYKNPSFLFFDEATNALDTTNEATIMTRLQEFFTGRTVIIVAHRLSTVKNADQIIVLNNGIISETGTHETLTKQKGDYFSLVHNQLELGL